jgi:hypothetical protein
MASVEAPKVEFPETHEDILVPKKEPYFRQDVIIGLSLAVLAVIVVVIIYFLMKSSFSSFEVEGLMSESLSQRNTDSHSQTPRTFWH